jgi:hypothetical protein
VWLRRAESARLTEQLADFRARMRLCAAEARIGAQTDARILLTKVDAMLREAQSVGADLQAQVRGLHAGKQDLQSRLRLMAPAAELRASKADAGALREANESLGQQLRASRGEIEELRVMMQVRCHSALRE